MNNKSLDYEKLQRLEKWLNSLARFSTEQSKSEHNGRNLRNEHRGMLLAYEHCLQLIKELKNE